MNPPSVNLVMLVSSKTRPGKFLVSNVVWASTSLALDRRAACSVPMVRFLLFWDPPSAPRVLWAKSLLLTVLRVQSVLLVKSLRPMGRNARSVLLAKFPLPTDHRARIVRLALTQIRMDLPSAVFAPRVTFRRTRELHHANPVPRVNTRVLPVKLSAWMLSPGFIKTSQVKLTWISAFVPKTSTPTILALSNLQLAHAGFMRPQTTPQVVNLVLVHTSQRTPIKVTTSVTRASGTTVPSGSARALIPV